MIRALDNIGRIVVPAEVRQALGWEPGDPIEVLVRGREVVLRRFRSFEGAHEQLQETARVLAEATGCNVYVYDTSRLVAFARMAEAGRLPAALPAPVAKAMRTSQPVLDGRRFAVPVLRPYGGMLLGALMLESSEELSAVQTGLLRAVARLLPHYL